MAFKLLFVFFFFSISAFSFPPSGNDWINPSQAYYKIRIAEDGLYRITYNQLQALGMLENNPDPKSFQLYHQGKEVPIYISGENDGSFDTNDSILFYGKKNDGRLDIPLYDNPESQPNPEISLFTDESAYFLTYSPNTLGERYQIPSLTTTAPAEPYFIYTTSHNFIEQYYPGAYILDAMSLSEFINGEGYLGQAFSIGSSQNRSISTPGSINTADFNPFIEFYTAGRSNAAASNSLGLNHHLRVLIGSSVIKDTTYKGYSVIRSKVNIPFSAISSNSTTVTFSSVNDLGAATDFQAPAYVRITYPRAFNSVSSTPLSFKLQKNAPPISLLRYSNSTWQSAVIIDTVNAFLYKSSAVNGITDFVIQNPGSNFLIIADEASVITASVEKVNFKPLDGLNFSADFLIVTHNSLLEAAQEYADYKSSKGYKPFVITTEEIYNQFYYGVHHPLAIKNFARYLLSISTKRPEYLLLLGKGLEMPRNALQQDLVPTFGYPASDAALTSQIVDNTLAPAFATGRIPAKTPQQVRDYLEKLKSYDSQQDSLYRKTIIHAAGGKTSSENQSFRNYLNSLASIASKEPFGAKILNYNKNVTDPISENLTEKILKESNQGIGLLTFLGHGSALATEIYFGNLDHLNNQNKLPFYLINGCSTGNAFADASLGENYIMTKNKGAIGWIGTSSEGVASYLSNFSRILYENIFKTNYGKSAALNISNTIRTFQNPSDALNAAHARQYIYLGDPSISFYAPQKPDYYISKQDIILDAPNLTASSKTIPLKIIVRNRGKSEPVNLTIAVKRTLPDNSIIEYASRSYKPVYNTDTLTFEIENDVLNAGGNNKFLVIIDPVNSIDETDKKNNTAEVSYFIPLNGISIISPAPYAVVNSDEIILKVQSNNLFTKGSEYTFEIDTIKTFDSSWKKSTKITSNLFASWLPPVIMEPNKVYYWRCRLNSSLNEPTGWQQSSFTYLPGSNFEWNQSHYQQFDNMIMKNLEFDTEKEYEYSKAPYPILTQTCGDQSVSNTERYIRVSASEGKISFNSSNFQGVTLIAFDPLKQGVIFNYPSPFNFKNDGVNGSGQFYFNPSIPAEADSLVRYINNIPEGYYVAGMSGVDFSPKDLPESIKTAFNSLGLAAYSTVGPGEPYAFAGKKGASPGTAAEQTADYSLDVPARQQIIILRHNFLYSLNNGYIISEKIGPADNWNKVQISFLEDSSDQLKYSIIGVRADGSETELITDQQEPTIDLSSISSEYPFIKLKAELTDLIKHSAAKLNYWRVEYTPYSEVSFNPELNNEFHSAQIQQGDSLRIKLGITNLGVISSDSLQVDFTILKNDRSEIRGSAATIPPLSGNKDAAFSFSYPTHLLIDTNQLRLTIIPKNKKDQYEFNNYITYPFRVLSDNKPPLLDVFFDGKRIINGETVSPKPQILITVSDENNFLVLNDTTSVEVFLKKHEETDFQRISFSSNKISLQNVGTVADNKASFLFQPGLLADGVYELKIRSRDKSGNYVSSNDYETAFEVINEESITNFFPYPNPFTTSMRFVFKITGQRIPDKIKIKIMTVTGKVVREVSREELGNLRIGNNISTFVWDGTDEYGDRLANGVYFYQVIVENNDKTIIKHRATAADSMFKKNFGKIYLIR